MASRKNLKYYLNLNWSYTIEQEIVDGNHLFIIHVNELPGVCTDAKSIEEGMQEIKEAIEAAVTLYLKNGEEVPEPIKKERFKGNIAYRTTSERHYKLAKVAQRRKKSISKTIDELLDLELAKVS